MQPKQVENPPNPWSTNVTEYLGPAPNVHLQIFQDNTHEILATNDSPDVGFTYSVNPYRGCFHACAYCYARPSHEYLSFGSGTDFDRKIVVKPRAAELLRASFERRSWKGDCVVFSGNTDCYQPLEASYRLTRSCLEVCAEYKNPAYVITKSPLIERDVDVLCELARVARVGITVSIPFWNEENARAVEPYVATPRRRMNTVRKLVAAGLDVGVNLAPIIPGLSDQDIPAILEAAAEAGAKRASMILVRLPGSVKEVFRKRIEDAFPLRASRILARTREIRGGRLNDPRFGSRHTGEGVYAETLSLLFRTTAERLGIEVHQMGGPSPPTTFERPQKTGQLRLLF